MSIADLNLRTSRSVVQSCGSSIGLAVVGERALWLGLSGLSDRAKMAFLDAPVESKALFGASVTANWQQCDLRKQEGEALQTSLPCKSTVGAPDLAWPNFTPTPKRGQLGFRNPSLNSQRVCLSHLSREENLPLQQQQ